MLSCLTDAFGGFELVLPCDQWIAEHRTVFPFDGVKLGFLPGMARRLREASYATDYERYSGQFLAAQYRAFNSEPFDRLVAKAATAEKRERGRSEHEG